MKPLSEEQIKKQRTKDAIVQFTVSLFMCAVGVLGFCYTVDKQSGDEWGFALTITVCLTLIVAGAIIAFDALDYLLSKEI